MNNVSIRIATIDDAESIERIDKEYNFDQYSRVLINQSLNDQYTINFIADVDGSVAGYLSSTIIFEECNILKIVVATNYRNCGIATKLMQYTMQYVKSKEVKVIFLEVRKSNAIAKRMYEKLGFKLTYERKKYYDDGEDADIYYFYL